MTRKMVGVVAIGAAVALMVSVPAYGLPVSHSSQVVQIGGKLVPPSQLSTVGHQLSTGLIQSKSSTGSTSHVGRDVVIGVVGFFALMLVAMGVTVPRRPHGFSTA